MEGRDTMLHLFVLGFPRVISLLIFLVVAGCSSDSSRCAEYRNLNRRLADAASRKDAGGVAAIGGEMAQKGMSVEEFNRLCKY